VGAGSCLRAKLGEKRTHRAKNITISHISLCAYVRYSGSNKSGAKCMQNFWQYKTKQNFYPAKQNYIAPKSQNCNLARYIFKWDPSVTGGRHLTVWFSLRNNLSQGMTISSGLGPSYCNGFTITFSYTNHLLTYSMEQSPS
jgi:hypothetical protein